MLLGQVASRVIDPFMVAITLGIFASLWVLAPRLGVLASALLASLTSAILYTMVSVGVASDLPLDEVDLFFARLVAALFQCGIAAGLVRAWRQLRS